MSHLLIEIRGNKYLNRTFFPHKLAVYDNKVVYKSRTLFRINEVTITYNHMSQVDLSRGIFFASLEIINTGGVKDIIIKHVGKKSAIRAKLIIDQKLNQLHHGTQHVKTPHTEPKYVEVEKGLHRLKELLHKERISKKEYNKKRKKILKKLR